MAEPALNSRERILELLRREPGLHLRELPRRLGLSLRAVRYHLQLMEERKEVVAYRAGRFQRWFPAVHLSAAERTLISALRISGHRAVLKSLLTHGPARFTELHSRTKISPGSLSRSLRQLIENGLVTLDPEHEYRVFDSSAVRMQLSLIQRRFPDILADAAREMFEEPP